MVNCILLNFFHILLQQWKVVGQPPTRNVLLSSIRLSISLFAWMQTDSICLDANSPSSQIMRISSGLPVSPPQQCKLARWCLSMAEFNFKIEHHAGSTNVVPDVLSCAPLTYLSTTGDDLFLPPQPVTCSLNLSFVYCVLSLFCPVLLSIRYRIFFLKNVTFYVRRERL